MNGAGPTWITERGWVLPDRGGNCFDQVPLIVERVLSGSPEANSLAASHRLLDARYDRVLLVYVDAFGGRLFERHAEHPLLVRAETDGVLARLTSQFPSTTAAHVTTVHTGLPVEAHGVYEWFMFEPSLNRLIAPLLFSFAGDNRRDTLAGLLEPAYIYPADTIYRRLAEAGVTSFAAQPSEIAWGRPNEVLLAGAEIVAFDDLADGLGRLVGSLSSVTTGYGFAYIDEIDALMHRIGPDSDVVDAAVERILTTIDRAVRDLPTGTLVLLTSDHGMSPVSPERTLYVNRLLPGLTRHLAHGADGRPLAPAGSCRDLFLHVLPGREQKVVEKIANRLGEAAEVHLTSELLAAGLFGPEPTDRLLTRLGQVVVLPRLGEAVYWSSPGRFAQNLFGHHGGLTAEEAVIPLAAFVSG
jgi:predicted AlkP superfamily pyrophosphatase or phosphodiesterase